MAVKTVMLCQFLNSVHVLSFPQSEGGRVWSSSPRIRYCESRKTLWASCFYIHSFKFGVKNETHVFCVSSGNNTMSAELAELCYTDDKPSGPLYSTGNSVTLRFLSDSSTAERGFLLSVQPGL